MNLWIWRGKIVIRFVLSHSCPSFCLCSEHVALFHSKMETNRSNAFRIQNHSWKVSENWDHKWDQHHMRTSTLFLNLSVGRDFPYQTRIRLFYLQMKRGWRLRKWTLYDKSTNTNSNFRWRSIWKESSFNGHQRRLELKFDLLKFDSA